MAASKVLLIWAPTRRAPLMQTILNILAVLSKSRSKVERDYPGRIESLLFLFLILIEIMFSIFLVFEKRILAGHDGFHLLTIQYCFLNNVVNYGETIRWLPYVMHGTAVSIISLMAEGFLHYILLFSGALFKSVNFIPIFYGYFFIDELLLLVGVWLLGRRFFHSVYSVCFVSISVMGSCIWMMQPWYNFHSYYAIPLIILLVHCFIDSGKWRFAFLAGNLLLAQSFGNLPHFLSVTSLVVFSYFSFYFLFNFSYTIKKIKSVKIGAPFFLTTALLMLSFILLYVFIKYETAQIASYSFRSQDGSVTLNDFLTYGGPFSWQIWSELFLGISPCVDYTLYVGVLCIPFIIFGVVFNFKKANGHFYLIVVVLLLFSMGTFVSTFFYYCWPMMKYYRHLVSVSPIIKIFLCFLAGFGADVLFINQSDSKHICVKKFLFITISACIFAVSVVFILISKQDGLLTEFVKNMVPKFLPVFLPLFHDHLLSALLTRTAYVALAASILFMFLFYLHRKGRCLFIGVIFLLFLHGADLYMFKFLEINLMTVPLNDEMYNITAFQPFRYSQRRSLLFWDNNHRSELLKQLPVVADSGSFYSSVHAFAFKDQLGNPFRTDFWMLPLDQYMRAYWGQSIDDISVKPQGLFYRSENEYPRLEFPGGHPAAFKISGVTEDKIQFFSQAYVTASEDKIASLITSPDYKGDIILLSPLQNKFTNSPAECRPFPEYKLSTDNRLHLPYQVQRFDSNNLVVTTNIDKLDSVWLFYSDVWHPTWRATVNGKEAPVYKANLAYKAVKLEKGYNEVHFFFKSRFISFFHYFCGINSLFWLLMIFFLVGKIVFAHSTGPKGHPPSSAPLIV